MKFLFLLALLCTHSAFAAPKKKAPAPALVPAGGVSTVSSLPDTNACAQMALAAVYAAQKSYEAEYKRFGATFNDIGYASEGGACEKNWDLSLRLFNGATEFLAEATHRGNGETWVINQRKELRQTREPK